MSPVPGSLHVSILSLGGGLAPLGPLQGPIHGLRGGHRPTLTGRTSQKTQGDPRLTNNTKPE